MPTREVAKFVFKMFFSEIEFNSMRNISAKFEISTETTTHYHRH